MSDLAQTLPDKQTWKLTLSYDGTDFYGWQVQSDKPTIQGELQAALGRIVGESPLPQGSGRTDAGVHALAQVASFALQAPIPPENLKRALNRTLPQSIRIIEAKAVPGTFHARHSAVAKTYEYRIFRGELCPPFLSRYVYTWPLPLDFGALAESAGAFVGEHDFLSFAASDPDLATREGISSEDCAEPRSMIGSGTGSGIGSGVRKIFSSAWERRSIVDGELPGELRGELWIYRVRGNGFLHHMVRNLVGTMLDVGRGQLKLDDLGRILAARSRPAAGPTAPARGLFLHSVEYNTEDRAGDHAGDHASTDD